MREAPRRLLWRLFSSFQATSGRAQPLTRCSLREETRDACTGLGSATLEPFSSPEGSARRTRPLTQSSVRGKALVACQAATRRELERSYLEKQPLTSAARGGQGQGKSEDIMEDAPVSAAAIAAPEIDAAAVPSFAPPRVQLYPPSTGCVSDFLKGPRESCLHQILFSSPRIAPQCRGQWIQWW